MHVEFKDYYKILGVEREATAEQIKKAFRKLARKYHPDVSKETDAEARMKELNEANAVLSDPEKRAAYDNLGNAARNGQDFRPPPGWDAGFEFSDHGQGGGQSADFSDFFSELFGRTMQQEARRRGPPVRGRGEDHHAKIMLDLADSYRGASRHLSLRMPRLDDQGHMVLAEHTLEVRIPVGVYDGQLIRLSGQGGPGAHGGEAGDLYLEVHFNVHARFRIEGRDVYATLPVAPWEAALGADVNASLPASTVQVHIPEGSQTGRKLRLKGKGIPASPPGDLYLVLEVVLPPAGDARAREIYQMMEREMAFNPRGV